MYLICNNFSCKIGTNNITIKYDKTCMAICIDPPKTIPCKIVLQDIQRKNINSCKI